MPTVPTKNAPKTDATADVKKNGKPKKENKKEKGESAAAYPILYPDLDVLLYADGSPNGRMTAEKAQKYLGWVEVQDDDYHFKDMKGKKIRCLNNVRPGGTNRPLDLETAKTYAQSILNRQWADSRMGPGETNNGEPWIIGKTGRIISCQHRAVGLVFAKQMWEESLRWQEIWAEEPSVECFVVTGVSESNRIVNTIDNVKPRTASDVYYVTGEFASEKPQVRKVLCKMLQYAVEFLWVRTGHDDEEWNPYANKLNTSMKVEFLNRHPRLRECVKHIYEENGGQGGDKIYRWFTLGYSSALMYLMATSHSDINAYRTADPPSEKQLDMDHWDKASDYWLLLADGGQELQAVREALGHLTDPDNLERQGGKADKVAILVKGWLAYHANGTVTPADVKLKYANKGDGIYQLLEHPVCGGIDLEQPEETKKADPPRVPTQEELRAEAERIKQENLEKMKEKPKAPPAPKEPSKTVAAPTGKAGGEPAKPPAPKLLKPKGKPAPKPVPAESV